ncbi:MAG: NUDIX domain-containing protein [Candidatus Magasanikbacteria bacterium]|jgi:ADP-ribose pyrophosphatase YjhB (NUDIX family)|nr:NUDIX domain-containing protein [Candidatus Magasanikbacteria bacterium]
MKINFKLPEDNKYHQFCPECHSEKIGSIKKEEKTYYKCEDCNGTFPRLIVIDPKIKWWIDEDTKEYWHESVGIFLFNEKNEVLLFERIKYPFVFTIPAGHLDVGEIAEVAVKREIFEETGLIVEHVKLFLEEELIGDKCRRGADNHKWHLYVAKIDEIGEITLGDEGMTPVWLSLEDALKKELTLPTKYFIDKYGSELII